MRFLIVLLLIPSAWAISDVLEAESLTLEAQWSGELRTITGTNPRLTSLEARVSLVPENHTTTPSSREENGSVVFEWTRLEPVYRYSISSDMTTWLSGGLDESEPWPTRSQGFVETELIDYNHPSIRAFAAQIADGETDTLRLAVRVADAVRDRIEYNLSTINIEATFPASEVLARGEGVCDEISVLYIATMRALGVPARYVSGYAFTDIFEPSGTWEAHGWSEVYINGVWVPFDLTYNEYIHLSAAHIPLRHTYDAQSTRISYSWVARDVDIQAEPLETSISIIEKGPPVEFGELEARFVHENVGEGWNELEISVHNALDSFIAPIVRLSTTQGLLMPPETSIIVPPRATRSVRLPVRITSELEPRFEYTFPVSVHAQGFDSAYASFKASLRYPQIPEPVSEEEISSHPDVSFSCSDALALPETMTISECTVTNTGNRNLELRICGDSCTQASVLIGDTKRISVPVRTGEGAHERTVRIERGVTSSTTIIATGRSPADVSLEAQSRGRIIEVVVRSDEPIDGAVHLLMIGYETHGAPGSYEIPSESFGLREDVRITYTYVDVDGEHTIATDVTVEQSIIEYIASRLKAWFSRLY